MIETNAYKTLSNSDKELARLTYEYTVNSLRYQYVLVKGEDESVFDFYLKEKNESLVDWIVNHIKNENKAKKMRDTIRKNKSDDYTKEDIIQLAKIKGFIETSGEFNNNYTLDGLNVRTYLEKRGFNVIRNRDTGYNGEAVTEEGIRVSTNGYCDMVRVRKKRIK